jgi:hypothetical protein
VSIAGDLAIVGADQFVHGNGAVFAYRRHPDGTWLSEAMLSATDGAYGDRFGFSVATDSETIVIGAINADEGAAYVLRRMDNERWTQIAKLTATEGERGGTLGFSVSIAQPFLVAGSLAHDEYRGAV